MSLIASGVEANKDFHGSDVKFQSICLKIRWNHMILGLTEAALSVSMADNVLLGCCFDAHVRMYIHIMVATMYVPVKESVTKILPAVLRILARLSREELSYSTTPKP